VRSLWILMEKIVSLCKRRGFIYPGSDIYGGFANTYTFGPYGCEMRKNVKDLWWKTFVQGRKDMVGIDGGILLHPKAWEASGHVDGFNDALVDCKNCKFRHRADHLIEEALDIEAEGLSEKDLTKLMEENKIKCPKCGEHDFTEARYFNLMFSTQLDKTGSEDSTVYLRPETAQAIFLEFQNVIDTMRVKLPFGIAQIGKAFRNEITPGNFIFRLLEFEAMEIEYFIREEDWEEVFQRWLDDLWMWCELIGLKKEKLSEYEHPKEKLSHYSKRTVDMMYEYPFGVSELYGLAYRTDFDLSQHSEYSKKDLFWRDPATNEKIVPHVVEPALGGDVRTVMHFDSKIAPVKVAFLPLMKKDGMAERANELYDQFKFLWNCEYDEGGAIGKRYRRQDEIGTPFCVTVDYETLEKGHKDFGTVTVRERDSMKQERIKFEDLRSYLQEGLGC
jgi:glycyl-tRNA synthetase